MSAVPTTSTTLLRQLAADSRHARWTDFVSRTKEVFRRTAIAGESPEAVARAFQMSRHAVDQIKSRSLVWLRERIAELEQADD